jgi:hypothetical protein
MSKPQMISRYSDGCPAEPGGSWIGTLIASTSIGRRKAIETSRTGKNETKTGFV